MKKIILLAVLVVSGSVFAAPDPKELLCTFKRTAEGEGEPFIHTFRLMNTRPAWEKSFRFYGFKARVEGESLILEVREEDKVKVVTASLNEPWTKKRDPAEPKAEFDFGTVESEISCR